MIYVEPSIVGRREITVFVAADSLEEMFAFGARLGWEDWYITDPSVYGFVAYDVTERMRVAALAAGARERSCMEVEKRATRLVPEWMALM